MLLTTTTKLTKMLPISQNPIINHIKNLIPTKNQPPQALVWYDSKPYWRGGPWDGGRFIGIPEQEAGYSNLISLMPANSQGGAYLTVNLLTSSGYRWLYIKPNGVFQMIYWDREENMWDFSWEAPDNACDLYGVCGSFAICTNKSPICDCLQGFVPMSNEEWSKSNWTRGCVRRSELLCEKNQTSLASGKSNPDKFQVLKGLKLPDRYHYFPDMEADECQHWCMGNCSCKAYAFVTGIYCMAWTEDLIDIEQFSFGRKTKLNHLSSDVEIVSRDKPQEDVHKSFKLPIYEFKQIITATDNFSYRNKLGEGGFGPVYKGMLDNGKYIAVKRLSGDSGQGIDEFKNEIAFISKLQHRNLVKLLGCCIEGTERLLIYEYLTNKSLDAFLFDPKKRGQLDWSTRFNIIQGIGRGLIYLHRDSCLRVIHRDLKCGNILLDEKMNPKISDFGLARNFQMTQEFANTRRIVGTYGYMSPEYATRGVISEKSDVFSYGVMLLEIASGKRNTAFIHQEQVYPLAHAWKSWKEGRGEEFIDQALAKPSCLPEGLRCLHVGLLCVQDLAKDRPTMTQVVSMLCSEINLPEPKEPLFTLQRLSGNSIGQESVNNVVTISMVEGR
ncbi:G-type lectin S-receptor-like serine/threonine-protein kinase [Tanacetum coccineum]